ncbi:MAG: ABC transporter ATP-binding protein [Elusimicrobia bacterium]|nr:ABC transporter ATP-binding protein [Elusimicrobiota bacterium]
MITVKNLHKSFGSKKVLNNVSLSLNEGETLAIIGLSGTGKSVLLKHIVGLIKPDSGEVFVDDIEITKIKGADLSEVQKKMGYVFQEAALFDSMTVAENVGFGVKNLTSLEEPEISRHVTKCLNMVGLTDIEGLKPSALSGGMKKRVGLARAIAYEPKYIFYDEPTTGLDPIMTDVISDLINHLKKKLSITSIVVTHDIKSAYKIADRIIMLHKGEVIFTGTPEQTKITDNAVVRQFVEGLSEGPIKVERTFGDTII